MSTKLVRLFTCASIISLGGLTAATSTIVACSSSTTAAPTDDDDDDDDNEKKDAGKSSSSSSSSGGDAGEEECNPIGTWTIPKPTFLVTTAGAVCDQLKTSGEANGAASEIVITKEAAGYKAIVNGNAKNPLILAAADEGCEIGGGLDAVGVTKAQGIKDGDGNPIEIKLDPITQFYIFNGDEITSKLNTKVTSVPAGAKGTPCDITQVANGARKVTK